MARDNKTHGVLAWSDDAKSIVPEPFMIEERVEDRPRPALQIPLEMPLRAPERPAEEDPAPRVIIIPL